MESNAVDNIGEDTQAGSQEFFVPPPPMSVDGDNEDLLNTPTVDPYNDHFIEREKDKKWKKSGRYGRGC